MASSSKVDTWDNSSRLKLPEKHLCHDFSQHAKITYIGYVHVYSDGSTNPVTNSFSNTYPVPPTWYA